MPNRSSHRKAAVVTGHSAGDTSLQCLRFALFDRVSHAITTRHGGVSPVPFDTLNVGLTTDDLESNVRTNRARLLRHLSVNHADVAVGRLSHGNSVSVFRAESVERGPIHSVAIGVEPAGIDLLFRSDAVVSNVPKLHFLLTFADCVPLLFYDTRRRVLGAAHAGWRGTALGIASEVVTAMKTAFGTQPRDLVTAIGPSIGPCCYHVRPDVIEAFRRNGKEPVVTASDGRLYLDLWSTNASQLRKLGVAPDAIENPRICTSCSIADFYSHRAERGRTGRFALCAGLQ